MPPPLLFDLSSIDQTKVQHDAAQIERIIPQRGAMRMIDGIIWASPEHDQALAFKDVRSDEFWVPGHIPGRPLLPGVLMIEAAAQLASYLALIRMPDESFLGFVGVDEVKFRGAVVPGDRLLILGKQIEFRKRRFICACQGVAKGILVFDGIITGMTM